MKLSLSKTKKKDAGPDLQKSKKPDTASSDKPINKNKTGLRLPAIFSLLNSRHPVAGLAIVDNNLYGITLRQEKNSSKPSVVGNASIFLAQGVIVNGQVSDAEALTAAFSKIWSGYPKIIGWQIFSSWQVFRALRIFELVPSGKTIFGKKP